jgi:hypothetical protein
VRTAHFDWVIDVGPRLHNGGHLECLRNLHALLCAKTNTPFIYAFRLLIFATVF